jgi:hypothetical protein
MSDGALSQDEIDALLAGADPYGLKDGGSDEDPPFDNMDVGEDLIASITRGVGTPLNPPKPTEGDPFEKFVLDKLQEISKSLNRLYKEHDALTEEVNRLRREKSDMEKRDEKFKDAINEFMLPE